MTQFLATTYESEILWLCPLVAEHGFSGAPGLIGMCSDETGRTIEVRLASSGLTSDPGIDALAHMKCQVNDIVQNRIAATAKNLGALHGPMILASGKYKTPQSMAAMIRITMTSLAKCADFIAHTSILNALYKSLGMKSDVDQLYEIASAMTIKEGMWLPFTNADETTCVMKVGAETNRPGCRRVTFFGPSIHTSFTRPGSVVRRLARWTERNSTELHFSEAAIGTIV